MPGKTRRIFPIYPAQTAGITREIIPAGQGRAKNRKLNQIVAIGTAVAMTGQEHFSDWPAKHGFAPSNLQRSASHGRQ
jgi:hypothetical protein